MAADDKAHQRSVFGAEGASSPKRRPLALGLLVLDAMALRRRLGEPKPAHAGNKAVATVARPGEPAGSQAQAGSSGGRGHEAETPSEIPAHGWKDIAVRVYRNIQDHRLMLIAAGVTYYSLLALFPALAALVSLFGLVADPEAIQQQLANMEGVVPEGALQIIGDQISQLQAQGGGTLGLYFFIGLAISLWSANAGVKSIFEALNVVHDEPERRSFIQYNLQALLFTLGGILFIILAVTGIVVLPAVLAFVGLQSMAGWIISIVRWPLLLIAILLGLALLYRYGPSRENPEWRWVSPGSIFTAVVWLAGSILFSWYVSNFGSYNKTYGSLGAVVGFMVWMWLSATIVLIGAEINAETEAQTRKDTTSGAPRPMGQRGARAADHVASGA